MTACLKRKKGSYGRLISCFFFTILTLFRGHVLVLMTLDWAIYRKIVSCYLTHLSHSGLTNRSRTQLAFHPMRKKTSNQLQIIEQKLLAHDLRSQANTLIASIMSRRSELLTAFKPAYEEGNLEGFLSLFSDVTIILI